MNAITVPRDSIQSVMLTKMAARPTELWDTDVAFFYPGSVVSAVHHKTFCRTAVMRPTRLPLKCHHKTQSKMAARYAVLMTSLSIL